MSHPCRGYGIGLLVATFERVTPLRAEPSRHERAERTADLLARLARASDEAARRTLVDEVVELNLGVADSVAARYASRGVPLEDLRQVAYVALIRSVRAFDSERGFDFLAYSVPTMRGEIRRYFRDLGWMVRPPRRIQEMQARLSTARAELTFSLGRAPRPSELAEHLEVSVGDVEEALSSDAAFTPDSLDRPVGDGDDTLAQALGGLDPAQAAAEARAMLRPVVRVLGDRDRRILELRFVRGLTQQEIAEDIGITQMQVSRLLARIFRDLRQGLTGSADAAALVE
ncbi:sigma-70 family RNA polymerase sigma factor [Nocardioides mangrovicus]|uniref:Sigma-70 family RNA polymerase sigma factor n=1 Tax=Nocardioides mangrovicus TaxID=2478913 RepID=A0A3L8P8U5_9ACTN|nr:sigma-70 family RNA polymerase sigma factor [Nocardioides mangrovicus]